MAQRIPTTVLSAAGLIAGFGVALASGSRPLGGVVMALFGLVCIWAWVTRDGNRVAVRLTLFGLFMFAVSHGLGLLIGAWPAVFVVAAITAYACWRYSDSHWFGGAREAEATAAVQV